MDWSSRLIIDADAASEFFLEKIERICRELLNSPLFAERYRKQMEELCEFGSFNDMSRFMLFREFSKHLRQKILQQFDPFEACRLDVHVLFGTRERGKAVLHIRALERLKGDLYRSPIHKLFANHSKQYPLAYTRHAIDRLFERFAILTEDPLDCARAFDVLYWMRNIHITQSYNGQLMAAIWCPVEPFSKTADFYRDLFEVQTPLSYGTKEKPYPHFAFAGRELLFRAGYFWLEPRTWNGEEVLTATTFVLPGMDNTPEYTYFLAMEKPDTITLEKFRTWIAKQTVAQLEKSADFSFLKRFHDCVLQVSLEMDDLPG